MYPTFSVKPSNGLRTVKALRFEVGQGGVRRNVERQTDKILLGREMQRESVPRAPKEVLRSGLASGRRESALDQLPSHRVPR